MPTYFERAYWGMGDASDIRVFDLDISKLGASICYEHHMTMLRAAMAIKGEEIHCALWPGWWKVGTHLGDKVGEVQPGTCDIESAIRQHAIENQVFVVSSSWFLKPEDIPDNLKNIMKHNRAIGGSCIVNPAGLIIEGPLFGCEGIVCAEVDLSERELAKVYLDTVGHYSRPDLLTLNIRDEAWIPTGPQKLEDATFDNKRMQSILERYGLSLSQLEAILKEQLGAG
jgi:amidase/nitrilase